jgi:hypothetical protein
MKKITSQEKYKVIQRINERRSLYSKKREHKKYSNKEYEEYVKGRIDLKSDIKNIPAPLTFSFIYNCDESLEFFDKFFNAINEGYTKFHFDMTNIKDLGIETLLYIISLDKIYKEKINMSLKISIPKRKELKYKMIVSGFIKYFRANVEINNIDEETIFPICDGASNKFKDKDDGETCGEAVDFAKKFVSEDKHKDGIYRLLYVSLAELMLNTEHHAYDEDDNENIINNWYLYAVKLEIGIAFYFFDNGKGITKTARKKILDKAFGLIGLEQTNILKSVLDGDFRSKTGLPNRGKGLPQINELLTYNSVVLSVILTNKVLYTNTVTDNKFTFKKVKYNFRGSLFVCVLPHNNLERNENE